MEHVNGWCFRGIYKGGLWEDDLHVSAHKQIWPTFANFTPQELDVIIFLFFLGLAWITES